MTTLTPEEIERTNRKRYEEDYSLAQVSIDHTRRKDDYFHKLTMVKLGLINTYGQNKKALDLGCGTGDYLFASRNVLSGGLGVDFSAKAITEAVSKRDKLGLGNFDFRVSSARDLALEDETFELIYSFATLYYVPNVDAVILKIANLLKPGAVAILELGNLISLNTLVARAHTDSAIPCHIRVNEMRTFVEAAGLEVLDWRAFQILPFWGARPRWMRLLLDRRWKNFLSIDLAGKMLDERFSSIPLFKRVAFRHIIVCRKPNRPGRNA